MTKVLSTADSCPVSLKLAVFGGNLVKFKKLKYSTRDVMGLEIDKLASQKGSHQKKNLNRT